ncbi:MAG TPA: sulfotransferase [Anaerolineales bacterium]|nr:sulfotransferase [Anaerolineales bacterium]
MNHGKQYLDRPVFISGFQKSGTTLLLALLDGHPQLVVFPEELHFFEKVIFSPDKAKAVREETGFKMFLPNWDIQGWSRGDSRFREGYPEFDCIEFDRGVEKALQGHESDKDLLLQLVKSFAQVDNTDSSSKRHWVAKTPREEMFVPVMSKMFGQEFKLVYIVRDPRDVYLSISRKNQIAGKPGSQFPEAVINFCVYWQTHLRRALYYQKRHGNIRILQFEQLLRDPETMLRELCDFIQIDYSPELLSPTRHRKPWGGNSAFTEGFDGLSSAPSGRFKEVLDPRERAILEKLLSKELVLLGYEQDGSTRAGDVAHAPVPWLDYWITSLKYQRWYFSRQTYAALRYSFPWLH